uniref:Uncharacterized protein n=1 Tax=Anguilla anguilla TaxID=7936 RepID=A0A0E9RUL2_ANGAN
MDFYVSPETILL